MIITGKRKIKRLEFSIERMCKERTRMIKGKKIVYLVEGETMGCSDNF